MSTEAEKIRYLQPAKVRLRGILSCQYSLTHRQKHADSGTPIAGIDAHESATFWSGAFGILLQRFKIILQFALQAAEGGEQTRRVLLP
jgi:hypothetical protein